MSLINEQIKPFNTTAYKNNKFIDISEKDIKGKWSIFFFYPANFTFICPTELNNLSEFYKEFSKIKTEIYSISTDTHFSHKSWCDQSKTINNIKYTMISDSSWELTNNFNVMKIKNGKKTGISNRATFIIDPKGIIKWYEISSENVGRDASNLLRVLKALKFVEKNPEQVCPAKWTEGEKTILPSINLVGKI